MTTNALDAHTEMEKKGSSQPRAMPRALPLVLAGVFWLSTKDALLSSAATARRKMYCYFFVLELFCPPLTPMLSNTSAISVGTTIRIPVRIRVWHLTMYSYSSNSTSYEYSNYFVVRVLVLVLVALCVRVHVIICWRGPTFFPNHETFATVRSGLCWCSKVQASTVLGTYEVFLFGQQHSSSYLLVPYDTGIIVMKEDDESSKNDDGRSDADDVRGRRRKKRAYASHSLLHRHLCPAQEDGPAHAPRPESGTRTYPLHSKVCFCSCVRRGSESACDHIRGGEFRASFFGD